MHSRERKPHFEFWIVTGGKRRRVLHRAFTRREAAAFARRYNALVRERTERVRIERVIAYDAEH
jgi:hypothetical protein